MYRPQPTEAASRIEQPIDNCDGEHGHPDAPRYRRPVEPPHVRSPDVPTVEREPGVRLIRISTASVYAARTLVGRLDGDGIDLVKLSRLPTGVLIPAGCCKRHPAVAVKGL